MRVPPPLQPIDVEEAWEAVDSGMTLAEYSRRSGRAYRAIRAALLRAGHRLPQRKSAQRDEIDRRLYAVWSSMRARCYFTSSPLYERFGSRGILACREWDEFPAFRDWARANGYKPGLALVLKVRSRGYRPSNCTWGTIGDVVRAGLVGATRKAPSDANQPIDWDRAHKLYVTDGRTIPETASLLGASRRGLTEGIRKRGWLRAATPVHAREHGLHLQKAWNAMRVRARAFAASKTPGLSGKVHSRWSDFETFYDWAIGAGFREGLALTRIDRARPFGPTNCKWLPRSDSIEFHRPKRAKGHSRWQLEAFGEKKGAAAWSRDRRCKISFSTLLTRIRNGWSTEDAIGTPPGSRTGEKKTDTRVSAFGQTATISEWGRDPRARVRSTTIARRIKLGMQPEAAITTPGFKAGSIANRGGSRALGA